MWQVLHGVSTICSRILVSARKWGKGEKSTHGGTIARTGWSQTRTASIGPCCERKLNESRYTKSARGVMKKYGTKPGIAFRIGEEQDMDANALQTQIVLGNMYHAN